MQISGMTKSEARVAAMQKKAKQALQEKEREQLKQREKTAKLRALRLEKEATEKAAQADPDSQR